MLIFLYKIYKKGIILVIEYAYGGLSSHIDTNWPNVVQLLLLIDTQEL